MKMMTSRWYVKGVPFCNKKVYKRGTFSAKMVYKRVRGWTLRQSLLILNFVKYLPPPTLDVNQSKHKLIPDQ